MQNNRHFPQTENSLNNWDAPVRHAPGRYRDYREKYALTTGEVTARYCENITNPTVQPDGKTEMHTPIPDVAHVEQSKAYQEMEEGQIQRPVRIAIIGRCEENGR